MSKTVFVKKTGLSIRGTQNTSILEVGSLVFVYFRVSLSIDIPPSGLLSSHDILPHDACKPVSMLIVHLQDEDTCSGESCARPLHRAERNTHIVADKYYQ